MYGIQHYVYFTHYTTYTALLFFPRNHWFLKNLMRRNRHQHSVWYAKSNVCTNMRQRFTQHSPLVSDITSTYHYTLFQIKKPTQFCMKWEWVVGIHWYLEECDWLSCVHIEVYSSVTELYAALKKLSKH